MGIRDVAFFSLCISKRGTAEKRRKVTEERMNVPLMHVCAMRVKVASKFSLSLLRNRKEEKGGESGSHLFDFSGGKRVPFLPLFLPPPPSFRFLLHELCSAWRSGRKRNKMRVPPLLSGLSWEVKGLLARPQIFTSVSGDLLYARFSITAIKLPSALLTNRRNESH